MFGINVSEIKYTPTIPNTDKNRKRYFIKTGLLKLKLANIDSRPLAKKVRGANIANPPIISAIAEPIAATQKLKRMVLLLVFAKTSPEKTTATSPRLKYPLLGRGILTNKVIRAISTTRAMAIKFNFFIFNIQYYHKLII